MPRSYRALAVRVPEFTPFFAAAALRVGASTTGGLALGVLVYDRTRSPLLSALAMFGPSLAQVLGATLLMAAADRLPPRAALGGLAALAAAGTALLAVPGLPLWAVFAVLLGQGLADSLAGGVRYGLLTEILPPGDYLLGRSLLAVAAGVTQVAGFAAGGLLLGALSPRGVLLVSAALGLAAALTTRLGLRRRAPRAAGRPSPAETWRVNALLLSHPARRTLYLALWVPNGLIVGCESLFVPYDPAHAGLLFGCAAAGMLLGDTVAGRWLPERLRIRLAAPLRLLLAVPYLVFVLEPGPVVATAAVALASTGYAAGLLMQERLVPLLPEGTQGQALGLHSAGMLTMQGVCAALAGAVAQYTSPAVAITALAAASVVVTLALEPGLRPSKLRVHPAHSPSPVPRGTAQ
ncbi:MFS transporter [Streptomyces sp. NBC_00091]|uniref:MFS transporter n=1 Tax=Streptomyces sp. NBC_00091 TaxID=2975648 RepID=UPI0022576F6F|nr:MFS transporter [Streptomyces sp. NBC_00091]MCX5375118.1 MFS transporter [Streptomyces sp. NBC_00091]